MKDKVINGLGLELSGGEAALDALATHWAEQPPENQQVFWEESLVHCISAGWKQGVAWLFEHAPAGSSAPRELGEHFVAHYAPHDGAPFQGQRLAHLLAQRLNWERQQMGSAFLEGLLEHAIPYLGQEPAVAQALEAHWLSMSAPEQARLLLPTLQALASWPDNAQAALSWREVLNDTLLSCLPPAQLGEVFGLLMESLTGDAIGDEPYDVGRELEAFDVLAALPGFRSCLESWSPQRRWLDALRAPHEHQHALVVLAVALEEWDFPGLTAQVTEGWAFEVGTVLGQLANDQRSHRLWAQAVAPLVTLQGRGALPVQLVTRLCEGFLKGVDDAWGVLAFDIDPQTPESEFMGWVRRHRQVHAPAVAYRGPRL